MSEALAHDIARAAAEAGGRALIVGGWVRDRLLGLASKDIDIEVFGVEADALKALLDGFGRVDTVGESFTVYKIGGLDVSLPRRESKTGRGHKGFTVIGDPSLSIEDAARRRDFTINAISFDPLTGEYLDPCHGRDDLDARRLRVVDKDTFADDSLRVLRALQFAARFELTLDDEAKAICRAIALDDLPAERVWGEIEKLLLAARRPSLGFALALELGVIGTLFPELEALVGCEQEPEWHPEGDVWVHTLQVIDRARERIDDLERPQALTVMLGALCHDLGKPATTAFIDGRIRSPFHEEAGVAPATAMLDRLNVHSFDGYDVRAQVNGIVANHLKPGAFHKVANVSDGAFRRLALKVDLELLARVAKADCLGRVPGNFDCTAMEWFVERARALGVEHGAPKPFVLGRHVLAHGVTPGPHVGAMLKQIYEMQLDGRVTNLDDGLAELDKLIKAQR
ncbi:MAG: HD domain-containing protein [Acidobacteriota bacterium]|nr:HD domain-containing protein [Acidobacteriota bacterium]